MACQVISDCIEVMHCGYHADAIITLGGCDKSWPWLQRSYGCGSERVAPRSVPAAIMPLARKDTCCVGSDW